jgi:phosphatidyl-myo-inositol dimannoside synthase
MADAEPIRTLLTLHQGAEAGSVNSVLHLGLGMVRRGLRVSLVCPPGSAVEAEAGAGGLQVHPLALEPRRRLGNARRLSALLARHPVDLVNSQSSRDREALTLLGLFGRLPVPLVLTRRSWPRTTVLESRLAGRVAQRVIAVSQPVRTALEAAGIPAAKLVVVPNGLLTARIDRLVSHEEVEEWRRRIGWEPTRRTVGIVARSKDQDLVLRALAWVHTPVRLVLAGLDEGALIRPLPPIPDRHAVVRLPFEPAIRPLYDLLEVALHPSRWDALPQAVLEAMALGKPVIASRATGHEVLIRDEVDGLLVSPDDPMAWAAALDRVLGDAALADRLGREARPRAREGFPLERTIEETVRVYRTVLEEFRVPRSAFRVRAKPRPNGERGTGNADLLLAYDFPPLPGGISRALGEIARHAGMVVSTGRSPGDSDWDRAAGVQVLRVPVAAERLRTIGGLLRWARSADADAKAAGSGFVWAGNLKPAGHVARWLWVRRGLPYGLIVHGLDLGLLAEQTARSTRKRLLVRALFADAAGVVANSTWTAERYRTLVSALGMPGLQERVRVVPLGADPLRFRPDGPATPLGPGRWLLTVARLVPHKGIDTALEVMARLCDRYPDLRYAVAGDGPDCKRLAAVAERLGVGSRVRFLGQVQEADLPGLYRAAELYVGLSRQEGVQVEGFGLSLVEAQASGRPVVAGLSGGIADAVAEGESGLLVPSADAAAAAAAIAVLLEDEGRRAALGAAGRRRVERTLNWSRVAEELNLSASAFRGRSRR